MGFVTTLDTAALRPVEIRSFNKRRGPKHKQGKMILYTQHDIKAILLCIAQKDG